MSELYKYVLSRFFGVAWVRLIDHDGEINVRRVKYKGGRATADRFARTRQVSLLGNGKVSGASYVVKWEPYLPMSAKKMADTTTMKRMSRMTKEGLGDV